MLCTSKKVEQKQERRKWHEKRKSLDATTATLHMIWTAFQTLLHELGIDTNTRMNFVASVED